MAAAQPTPTPTPAPAESVDDDPDEDEEEDVVVCVGVAGIESVLPSLVLDAAIDKIDVVETEAAVAATDKTERLSTDHVAAEVVFDRTAGS